MCITIWRESAQRNEHSEPLLRYIGRMYQYSEPLPRYIEALLRYIQPMPRLPSPASRRAIGKISS